MILPATLANLEKAATILNTGGVVIIPTDTVYGIAAHPDFPQAVARIKEIKGRPSEKPIALLAADVRSIENFGGVIPAKVGNLLSFWPGALTLVLQTRGGIYEGFRIPDFDWTLSLLRACGGVLRVTSANLSGAVPALTAESTLADIGLVADCVFDAGVSPGGVASTVVKLESTGEFSILREGGIPVSAFKMG